MAEHSSDDEDLKRAIAMSLHDADAAKKSASQAATPLVSQERDVNGNAIEQSEASQQPLRCSLAGFDRKAMEQERLARLAARVPKRMRSISPPALSRSTKVKRTSPPPTVSTSATPTNSVPSTAGVNKPPVPAPFTRPASSPITAQTPSSSSIKYPHGKLLKTWAFGYPRSGTDIKIEEVLERSTLRVAVLSAFCMDLEWVFSKLECKRTKIHLVMSVKEPARRADMRSQFESLGDSIKPYFPSLIGNANCMHSKLMLLSHPDKLRVAVPSANLMSYDWGEGGYMENTVWLIDLPRLSKDAAPNTTDFKEELVYFIKKQGLHESVIQGLDSFDWSATSRYAFVHSIIGAAFGAERDRTGLFGLTNAVKKMGLTCEQTQMDLYSSSVGALTPTYTSRVQAAASGNLRPVDPKTALPPAKESFKLYFPTYEYMRDGPGGVQAGGTIFLTREHWERPAFPGALFHEYRSTRAGLKSHCKLIFVRGIAASPDVSHRSLFPTSTPKAQQQAMPVAYLYAGSANISETAWGFVTQERKGPMAGQVKIAPRNWECGVLIPVLGPGVSSLPDTGSGGSGASSTAVDRNCATAGAGSGVPDFSVFRYILDGPFEVPAPLVGRQTPWFVHEHRPRRGVDDEDEA